MYRHILIPTDGSKLAEKAVKHGLAMAQALNARATVLTVSAPFNMLVFEPGMISDTQDEYEQYVAVCAAKYWTQRNRPHQPPE